MSMTRREWLAALGTAPLLHGAKPAGAPVSIARCASYDEDLTAILTGMFDQLGGLPRLVRGKTVTIKLNLTGSPALRMQGRPWASPTTRTRRRPPPWRTC